MKVLSEENIIDFHWTEEEIGQIQKNYKINIKKEINLNKKAKIFSLISEICPKDTIYCSDFSYDDVNLQKFLKISDYKNNLMSGGNGTPGYGFPAAIGATFSRPKSKVVSISSGKNFQFNMQEMIVAVEQKINLSIVVINDSTHEKYPGPNYKLLAESFNVRATRIKISSLSKKYMKKFLDYKGVTLIEILI